MYTHLLLKLSFFVMINVPGYIQNIQTTDGVTNSQLLTLVAEKNSFVAYYYGTTVNNNDLVV